MLRSQSEFFYLLSLDSSTFLRSGSKHRRNYCLCLNFGLRPLRVILSYEWHSNHPSRRRPRTSLTQIVQAVATIQWNDLPFCKRFRGVEFRRSGICERNPSSAFCAGHKAFQHFPSTLDAICADHRSLWIRLKTQIQR